MTRTRLVLASPDAVFTAARRLRAAGRRVTARAVRQAIGGGSMRDIVAHLRSARTVGIAPHSAQCRDLLVARLAWARDELHAWRDWAGMVSGIMQRHDLAYPAMPGFFGNATISDVVCVLLDDEELPDSSGISQNPRCAGATQVQSQSDSAAMNTPPGCASRDRRSACAGIRQMNQGDHVNGANGEDAEEVVP